MDSRHREDCAWVRVTERERVVNRRHVDGGQEQPRYAHLGGTLDDGGPIDFVLPMVEVDVGVDQHAPSVAEVGGVLRVHRGMLNGRRHRDRLVKRDR